MMETKAPKQNKTVPEELDVFRYLSASQYLADLLDYRKKHQAPYSFRKYSDQLGFGATNYMYQIIAKIRPLTDKSAKKIASGIPLKGRHRKYFLQLVSHEYAKTPEEREAAFDGILALRSQVLVSDLDRSKLEYFSLWYHGVIRELVTLPQFSPDPERIAAALDNKITPDEAAYSLSLLQRLGYIRYDASRQLWLQTEAVIATPREVASLALMRYHQQMIQRAAESLFSVSAEQREVLSITFSASTAEAQAAKNMLQEFSREFVRQFGTSRSPERILQLNIQMFPQAQVDLQNKKS